LQRSGCGRDAAADAGFGRNRPTKSDALDWYPDWQAKP
jgi:hypothetical protein